MPTHSTIRACLFTMLTGPTFASPSFAQISADNQRFDLKQLYEALVTTHPGFDRYVTGDELLSQYKSLDNSISGSSSNWEFYRLAARMAAAVKCGHTRLRPSSTMAEEMKKFFPLPVAVAGGHMYVRLKNQSVKEVKEINGLSAKAIIDKIFQCTPVDGNADNGKYDFITASFPIQYARYVDHNPSAFKLVLQEGLSTNELTLNPIPLTEASSLSITQQNLHGPIGYEIRSGTGYLVVMTFSSEAYQSAGISYNDFLKETFRKMKASGVKRLVVDIRDNGGGDDQYGANLCSYLLNKPFSYFKTVKEKGNDGQFHSVQHPCLSKQQISANAFAYDVALLINGRTFSTAADVAAVFKNSRRGTVLGSETSGGYEGNTSGRSTTIKLKNSGLTITIPQWYYENDVEPQKYAHRGVLPDVTIFPTLETLNAGTDAVLNEAIVSLERKN